MLRRLEWKRGAVQKKDTSQRIGKSAVKFRPSSEHDIAVILTNSRPLRLPAQIKTVQSQPWTGKSSQGSAPSEKLLAIDGCWGRGRVIFLMVWLLAGCSSGGLAPMCTQVELIVLNGLWRKRKRDEGGRRKGRRMMESQEEGEEKKEKRRKKRREKKT